MGFGDELAVLDEDLLPKAMEEASALGASYADVRLEASSQETAEAENGNIKRLEVTTGTSLGVRALAGGSWGFASMDVPEPAALRRGLWDAVHRAVRQAKATARAEAIELAPSEPVVARVPLEVRREPWPLDGKQDLIVDITREMRGIEGMVLARGRLWHILYDHYFASTEGSRISRRWLLTAGEYLVNATGPGGSQTCWIPFGVTGDLEVLELDNDPMTVGLEAARLAVSLATEAKVPKEGRTTVITTPEFNQLLVHEIVGHPTEGSSSGGRAPGPAGPGGRTRSARRWARSSSTSSRTPGPSSATGGASAPSSTTTRACHRRG